MSKRTSPFQGDFFQTDRGTGYRAPVDLVRPIREVARRPHPTERDYREVRDALEALLPHGAHPFWRDVTVLCRTALGLKASLLLIDGGRPSFDPENDHTWPTQYVVISGERGDWDYDWMTIWRQPQGPPCTWDEGAKKWRMSPATLICCPEGMNAVPVRGAKVAA
ncbi:MULTISPECIES: hypothetical protein [Methylobacteriaceae]|uniref:hypothetical protein n=1 Tax=Methylobacteriaceae TaxID=119045 RepID=UPI001168D276|nr:MULTISPECIES: hypothetical protein [Methylobacteriaceae]GEL44433.1 hypothetical protein MEX01_50240 [Methylorubrum extorquens]